MKAGIQTFLPKLNRDVPLWRFEVARWACRDQKGAVAVIFALVLCVLVAFCGLALDLARVYNRKVEVQNVADAVALAAARKLNGTASGITDAKSAAAEAATALKYEYNRTTIRWTDSALKFSTSPDRGGDWVDSGTAASMASRIFFVKVDTSQLSSVGDVTMVFMPAVSSTLTTATTSSGTVAGRVAINAAPLAVCPISNIPAGTRNSGALAELVEYGFRRGISYDLMNLNAAVVNPLATPGTAGASADMLPAAVGPYVCTGTLGIPRLTGDSITVSQPFPIASLYKQLNSRFDQYEEGLCNFHAAPPDTNIQSYDKAKFPLTLPWLNTTPLAGQAAAPGASTAAQYGPLWAYAKAVPRAAYIVGAPEPSPNGYSTFTTASWSTLYGGQTVKTYPAGATATPYKASTGVNFAGPDAAHKPWVKDRRVLNVPLLDCSGASAGTSAPVLAIGRFFMMVPATASNIYAEFAGAVPLQNVEGQVELFP